MPYEQPFAFVCGANRRKLQPFVTHFPYGMKFYFHHRAPMLQKYFFISYLHATHFSIITPSLAAYRYAPTAEGFCSKGQILKVRQINSLSVKMIIDFCLMWVGLNKFYTCNSKSK